MHALDKHPTNRVHQHFYRNPNIAIFYLKHILKMTTNSKTWYESSMGLPYGEQSTWDQLQLGSGCVRLQDEPVSKVFFYLNSFMIFIKLC